MRVAIEDYLGEAGLSALEAISMTKDEKASVDGRAQWLEILTEGHRNITFLHKLFRYLPGPPRCKVCHNPFGGIGGKIVGLVGFRPSRKNPLLCSF